MPELLNIALLNRRNAAYQLRRTDTYQKDTNDMLYKLQDDMPLDMHTALHVRYDAIQGRRDQIEDASKPDAQKARRVKHKAKRLRADTKRSSQRVESEMMWERTDIKNRISTQDKVRNKLTWSHFGLPDLSQDSEDRMPLDVSSDEEDGRHPKGFTSAWNHPPGFSRDESETWTAPTIQDSECSATSSEPSSQEDPTPRRPGSIDSAKTLVTKLRSNTMESS